MNIKASLCTFNLRVKDFKKKVSSQSHLMDYFVSIVVSLIHDTTNTLIAVIGFHCSP